MNSYFVSIPAFGDLESIWRFYALEIRNVDFADKILAELYESFETLVRNPGIGHRRTDLTTRPVLFWKVRTYLVVYVIEEECVEIARILHGARDAAAILKDNP